MRTEVNFRGLTPEQVQSAIDDAKQRKGMTMQDLLINQRQAVMQLLEYDAGFGELAVECIKKHRPELLKQI